MFQEVSSFAQKVTDPTNIAAVVIAAASFITLVTVAQPLFNGDKLASRMRSVSTDRDELRRKSRVLLARESSNSGLRMKDKGPWKNVVERLNLKTLLADPNVESKLLQAGLRGPTASSVFYFCRFALPIIFFFAAFLYMFIAGVDLKSNQKLLAGMVACAFGFYLPNLVVGNMASKRQKSIMKAFPDALDLLLICVEAGISIEAAFAKVGEEIGSSSIELAEELGLTNAELAYLQDRRVAYENLAKRTTHPGVKAVTIALTQAERYGTPLGAALRVMAKENREMRMTEAEKKAAALPAQLTVPMIVFFLPVLFIVILTPAYVRWQHMNQTNSETVATANAKSTKKN